MNGRPIELLVVDDSPDDARYLLELLAELPGSPFSVEHVARLGPALSALPGRDVVLLDLSLPDAPGLASLEALLRASRSTPVVVLSGDDEPLALEACEAGARDYLLRSELTPKLLDRTLRLAIAQRQAEGRAPGPTALERAGAEPLVAGDRVSEAATFVMGPSGRRRSESDRAAAEAVAARASFALDNARLLEASQQALRSRDEVLAVVSHDLRNPLNVVSLALGMVESLPEPKRAPTLARARRAVGRMERLIADLLDVARIDAGTLHVEARPVDLAPLLDEAIELHRPLAAERGISLLRELEEPLPRVLADRDRVAQVLSNLIGNALKFTPGEGTVRLLARTSPRGAEVTVADSGPGIGAENLRHVFDRFWQKERRAGGVGLGLAIAKGIVEAHGGFIDVESRPGEGARFRFLLPRADESPADLSSIAENAG